MSHTGGPDTLSLMEHRAPEGHSPPLHIHRTEDELFHVLEGEFEFHVGDERRRLSAGACLLVPKGTPHTFRVTSSGPPTLEAVAHLTEVASQFGIEIVGPPLH
ncbi:MAG TPA: cupin domain-containing protein [Gemmatimonadaceae bacterium]|nr:cupin domain-containing protein [Gemmatimonadaceae bacterium]